MTYVIMDTPQEMIEKVRKWFVVEKHPRCAEKEYDGGRPMCRYRLIDAQTGEQMKCAVGVLIPDEVYIEDMEGTSIDGLVENNLIAFAHEGMEEFAGELQQIHDSFHHQAADYKSFTDYMEQSLDIIEKGLNGSHS